MPVDSLFLSFTDRLRQAGIEHMVTDSVACTVYGEPRLTHDVDLVVDLRTVEDASHLVDAFPPKDFYVPPLEVIRVEQARALRGHFNIIHHDTGFKADVYLLGRDPLHAWAFVRRRVVPVSTSELMLAPPEYVILRKLEYYREGHSDKHLDDIAGMLRVSGESIDVDTIARIAGERGLTSEWNTARQR